MVTQLLISWYRGTLTCSISTASIRARQRVQNIPQDHSVSPWIQGPRCIFGIWQFIVYRRANLASKKAWSATEVADHAFLDARLARYFLLCRENTKGLLKL